MNILPPPRPGTAKIAPVVGRSRRAGYRDLQHSRKSSGGAGLRAIVHRPEVCTMGRIGSWGKVVVTSSSRPCAGRVISIISPMGGDGRTAFCANVGAALADVGKKTVTVDPLKAVGRSYDDLRSLGDFILIDTLPLQCGGVSMVAGADEVIVVALPTWHTVYLAERLIESARSQHAGRNIRLVINRLRPADKELCDLLLEVLQLDLLGIVPEDDHLYRGELVALNPESPAGREYCLVKMKL